MSYRRFETNPETAPRIPPSIQPQLVLARSRPRIQNRTHITPPIYVERRRSTAIMFRNLKMHHVSRRSGPVRPPFTIFRRIIIIIDFRS